MDAVAAQRRAPSLALVLAAWRHPGARAHRVGAGDRLVRVVGDGHAALVALGDDGGAERDQGVRAQLPAEYAAVGARP